MLTVIPEVKFCFFPQSRKQAPVYRHVPPSIFNPLISTYKFSKLISIRFRKECVERI